MTPGRVAVLTPRASVHLDMLRGISAIVVVIGHVRGMFFTDLQALGSWKPSPVLKAIYGVTSLGHEAVMVFFVLSGFFIGGSVLNALDHWSWRPYLVNRLTRLYVVLVPALLLTALIDYVARGLPGGAQYYEHAIAHFNTEPYISRINPVTFLGNLVFLQTILVGPFGSNGPLWSLANEAWYYAMFPLAVLSIAGRAGRRHRLICGVLFVSCCLWLPFGVTAAFAIWLFGVMIHWLPGINASSRPRMAWWLAGTAGVSLAVVLASLKLHRVPAAAVGDFAVGACAAAVLYAIARIQWAPGLVSRRYASVATTLSRCSYSVYAVHFPLVMLLRVSVPAGSWRPTVFNLAAGAAIAAVLVLCGLLFSKLTEARTDVVRRRVMAWLTRDQPAPVVVAG